MTIENLAEHRIKAHLRMVQTSPPDQDDEHYQEGASRYRKQQLDCAYASWGLGAEPPDYARHTDKSQPIARVREVESLRRWQRIWHVGSAILAGIVFALVVLLVTAWLSSSAYAQTPASVLVRACPTQPTTTGWSACSNSVWAAPAPNLIVDAQRLAVDTWLTPGQLVATDRVFACTDASVRAGPFVNCPTPIAGQTNNYLLETAISFGTTPPPVTPTPTTITVTLNWPAITQDNQVPPNTLSATQPVGYQVFMRSNACTTSGPACQVDYYGRPPVADVTTITAKLGPLNGGPYCFVVGAYFKGDPTTIGTWSTEACITGLKITPARVTSVTVSWQ